MTIAEKVKNSISNTLFTLYKEGIFYKCYNQDAMLFVKYVKPYKVKSKFIKNVGTEVLSLGFPASEVSKGNLTFDMLCETLGAIKYEIEAENITFYLKEDVKQGYESWQETVIKENAVQYTNKLNSNIPTKSEPYISQLITMINNYDLANSTPMQGLNFIQQKKRMFEAIVRPSGNTQKREHIVK